MRPIKRNVGLSSTVSLDLLIFDISNLDRIPDLFKCHVVNLLVGNLKILKSLMIHYFTTGKTFQKKMH